MAVSVNQEPRIPTTQLEKERLICSWNKLLAVWILPFPKIDALDRSCHVVQLLWGEVFMLTSTQTSCYVVQNWILRDWPTKSRIIFHHVAHLLWRQRNIYHRWYLSPRFAALSAHSLKVKSYQKGFQRCYVPLWGKTFSISYFILSSGHDVCVFCPLNGHLMDIYIYLHKMSWQRIIWQFVLWLITGSHWSFTLV